MTNSEFREAVNKYAILIFIGYSLNLLVTIVIQRFIPSTNSDNFNFIGILASSTWLIQLTINIIVAILISKDLKKYKIKNNLIVVMTILFSLIGITMFFIITNREIKDIDSPLIQ